MLVVRTTKTSEKSTEIRVLHQREMIGWCPLNKTWQTIDNRISVLDDVTWGMYLATKAMSLTRPVLDAPGLGLPEPCRAPRGVGRPSTHPPPMHDRCTHAEMPRQVCLRGTSGAVCGAAFASSESGISLAGMSSPLSVSLMWKLLCGSSAVVRRTHLTSESLQASGK